MIALLVLVLALATATRGAKSWIPLPFFNFQPSELGKVLLVVALSGFLVDRMRRMGRDTTARIMLLGAAAGDARHGRARPRLGDGLRRRHARGAVRRRRAVEALRGAGRALRGGDRDRAGRRAGGRRRGAQALPGGPPHVVPAPASNPGGEGYQQQQSKIAIGSGEKTGRGVAHATQTALNFLPEHHTDFIFAVIGETYGFAGCALVLSLYALLIWRGLHILTMAKNLYGALLAGGIT